MSNATVGTPKKFTLLISDQAGLPVDLAAFPTALTDIVWSVNDASTAEVVIIAPSLTEVEVTFSKPGKVTLTASGKNKAGADVVSAVEVVGELPVPLVAAIQIVEA